VELIEIIQSEKDVYHPVLYAGLSYLLFSDTWELYRLLYLLKVFLYERTLQDKVS